MGNTSSDPEDELEIPSIEELLGLDIPKETIQRMSNPVLAKGALKSLMVSVMFLSELEDRRRQVVPEDAPDRQRMKRALKCAGKMFNELHSLEVVIDPDPADMDLDKHLVGNK